MAMFHCGGNGGGSDDCTAYANQVLPPYTAITRDSNDVAIVGTMPTKSAQTYTPTTYNQTIASGQYLSGNQTIQGSSNLVVGNIKSGVTIFSRTGTFVDRSVGRSLCWADDLVN